MLHPLSASRVGDHRRHRRRPVWGNSRNGWNDSFVVDIFLSCNREDAAVAKL
jgi:hypothetical protein